MLPGPTIVRRCPKCDREITEPTLASGNTFGAQYWTDGKRIARMLPEYPQFVKCPQCSSLFWLEDAEQIGQIEVYQFKTFTFPSARHYDTPTEGDYLAAVQHEKFTPDRERYIRIRAWWFANDQSRALYEKIRVKVDREEGLFDKEIVSDMAAPVERQYVRFKIRPSAFERLETLYHGAASEVSFSEEQKNNLAALHTLLDENDPERRIMKAEVARERGLFDEALELLQVDFSDRFKRAVDLIGMLCKKQSVLVAKL